MIHAQNFISQCASIPSRISRSFSITLSSHAATERARSRPLRILMIRRTSLSVECAGSSWCDHPSSTSVVTTVAQMCPGIVTLCTRTFSSTLARASAPLSVFPFLNRSLSFNSSNDALTSRRNASGSAHVCCSPANARVHAAISSPSSLENESKSPTMFTWSSFDSVVHIPASRSTTLGVITALTCSSDMIPKSTNHDVPNRGLKSTRMFPGCKSECTRLSTINMCSMARAPILASSVLCPSPRSPRPSTYRLMCSPGS
mmetsp:Transcript_4725/g.13609  ORF Transcript_4725/g.13609 Transcript_4725/m.13609 type:complete len:259 (+) Transcript_4725:1187-1963(+)